MYGPTWPFLLMYGSHKMKHTGFPRVDGLSTDPRDLGRHTTIYTIVQNNFSYNSFMQNTFYKVISMPHIGLLHNHDLVGESSPCTPSVLERGSHDGVSNAQ